MRIGLFSARVTCAGRGWVESVAMDWRWAVLKARASSSMASPCAIKCVASYKASKPGKSPVNDSLKLPSSSLNLLNTSVYQRSWPFNRWYVIADDIYMFRQQWVMGFYQVEYGNLLASEVGNEEKHWSGHHYHHHPDYRFDTCPLMLLWSPFQTGMPIPSVGWNLWSSAVVKTSWQ